jgi:hypothetical protein
MIALTLALLLTLPQGVGVSTAWQRGDAWTARTLETLQPELWMNWVHSDLDDPRYLPMAFSFQRAYHDGYIEAAQDGPRRLWLLGNEPELPQSAGTPEDAAWLARRWANEVGGPWACCGNITHHLYPQLLDWPTAYLAAGGLVPDAWHVHIYFVQSGAEWDAALAAWQGWMVAHNAVRPVIVSETAFTEGTGWGDLAPVRAAELLRHVRESVARGDVRAVLWYSDADYWGVWPWSNLLTQDGTLTSLGQVYMTPLQPTADTVTGQPGRLWLPVVN